MSDLVAPRHVIAIDPGSEESALLVWNGQDVEAMRHTSNENILTALRSWRHGQAAPLVIEMIGHYGTGMPAGKTVFDTCVWIGRFTEAYNSERVHVLLRATIKAHICGSARAKDGNVRQALIDRFGGKEKAIGRKASPGPFHGVHTHAWAALAVAVTFWDQNAAALDLVPVGALA